MERFGPIMLALGAIADFASGVLWFVAGAAEGPLGIAITASAMVALLLTFGGAWLTILWGEADGDLLQYCAIAIVAHVIALMAVAFLPLGPIISGLLFMVTAVTVGIATTHAWRATGPDVVPR